MFNLVWCVRHFLTLSANLAQSRLADSGHYLKAMKLGSAPKAIGPSQLEELVLTRVGKSKVFINTLKVHNLQ